MKALSRGIIQAQRLSGKKKNRDNENSKLLSADASESSYNGTRPRHPSETSSRSSSRPTSPQVMRRAPSSESTHTNLSFDPQPVIQIRPGQHPPPASPTKVDAVMDIDFGKVPFQFYSLDSEDWKTGIIQAFVVVLVCILVPSLFVLFILCGNKIRMDSKPKMTKEERKSAVQAILSIFMITFIKDLIVIMIVLHVKFESPISAYAIGYSPIVFIWWLILFLFSLLVYYFSDVKYVFGFDSDRKALLKVFKQLVTSKAKQDEFKKIDDQEKYFIERYTHLSSIKGSTDEFTFLLERTPKVLMIIATIASVTACIVHCLIPLFLQILDCSLCQNTIFVHTVANFSNSYNSSNSTTYNETLPTGIYKTVLGLSALNSLLVSALASAYFIYLTLWKIAMLKEWKRFNETEEETSTTIVNSGPQGIAMWWKIRQTLQMFSTSNISMTVLNGKMACIVATIIQCCLSITLLYETVNLDSSFHAHAAVPLLFDNVLLYVALFVIAALNYMINNEKAKSGHIIELKQLNISYELGRLMNLDQEHVESEPGVRIKVRVMRGCLMLLKELTSTMNDLERGTSSNLNLILFVVATLFVLPSTFSTARFLINKGGLNDD